MAWKSRKPLEYKTSFTEPAAFTDSSSLQEMMLEVVAQGASDTFIQSNQPVLVEINGDLQQLTERRLTTDECVQLLNWACGNEGTQAKLARGEEAVGAYSAIDPVLKDNRGEKVRHRFRVNGSRIESRGSLGVQTVMRSIPTEPPRADQLGLDAAIMDACTPRNGIVYITGPTGSGKTTTFAGMIRHIVEGDTPIKGNICTLEHPIEFIFEGLPSVHSTVAQQQIERDIGTFALGVRGLMRRKPALGVIGETRDWETADAAMQLSNTGHPVYTTLHVNEVAMVFPRLLKLCPPELRDSALFDIISTAQLLVTQALAKTVDGKRTALREYLVVTDDLRDELLAIDDPTRITSVVREMVRRYGRTMEAAATEAFEKGLIDQRELKKYQRRVAHG